MGRKEKEAFCFLLEELRSICCFWEGVYIEIIMGVRVGGYIYHNPKCKRMHLLDFKLFDVRSYRSVLEPVDFIPFEEFGISGNFLWVSIWEGWWHL